MKRVVIAEDHQLITEGYMLLLNKMEGFDIVATAGDGHATIEAVKKQKPDLLILDLHMPKLNGLEVLKNLNGKYPDMKILIISMLGDINIHKEVVRNGAHGYLLKNADQDEFIMAINKVIKGKCYYSSEIFETLPKIDSPAYSDPIPLVSLTEREEEILTLIANGLTNKKIAAKLIVSQKTVEVHRNNLMKKIGVHNVTALVKYAITHGYIQ